MRIPPLPRLLAPALVLAALSATAAHAQTRRSGGHGGDDELAALTRSFGLSLNGGRPGDFLPRSGDLTWVNTGHTAKGPRVAVWRFPAAQIDSAMGGPLLGVLDRMAEHQPIGRFVHQAMTRDAFAGPLRWRRVRGTRLVPVGEPDDAPFFVEWRREGGRWVVSTIGDETFTREPLPRWCC